MADLFDRLFPEGPEAVNDIAVHYFFAAMVDYATGNTTRQQIVNWWVLDTEAQVDFNALCDHIDGLSSAGEKVIFGTELHAVLMFAEAGAKYTDKTSFRTRLGLV